MRAGATRVQTSSLQLPAQPVRLGSEPALKSIEAAGKNRQAYLHGGGGRKMGSPHLHPFFNLSSPAVGSCGFGGADPCIHLGSAPLLNSPLLGHQLKVLSRKCRMWRMVAVAQWGAEAAHNHPCFSFGSLPHLSQQMKQPVRAKGLLPCPGCAAECEALQQLYKRGCDVEKWLFTSPLKGEAKQRPGLRLQNLII